MKLIHRFAKTEKTDSYPLGDALIKQLDRL